MEIWEQDADLNKKIQALIVQHKIDQLFEMPEYTFWSGIDDYKSHRVDKSISYKPNSGYETYEEQQLRLQIISDDLFDALMNK